MTHYDFEGNVINPGDTVVYARGYSGSASLHKAVVTHFTAQRVMVQPLEADWWCRDNPGDAGYRPAKRVGLSYSHQGKLSNVMVVNNPNWSILQEFRNYGYLPEGM